MTREEVKEYFGSWAEPLRQLNMAVTNAATWKKQGYIPMIVQYRIAELTDGELMPDEIDPKIIARQNKNQQKEGSSEKRI